MTYELPTYLYALDHPRLLVRNDSAAEYCTVSDGTYTERRDFASTDDDAVVEFDLFPFVYRLLDTLNLCGSYEATHGSVTLTIAIGDESESVTREYIYGATMTPHVESNAPSPDYSDDDFGEFALPLNFPWRLTVEQTVPAIWTWFNGYSSYVSSNVEPSLIDLHGTRDWSNYADGTRGAVIFRDSDGNETERIPFVLDTATCGTFLRWLDARGRVRYRRFNDSSVTTTTETTDKYTRAILDHEWEGESEYWHGGRYRVKSISELVRRKLTLSNVPNDQLVYIRSIIASPCVDMYLGESDGGIDQWQRVELVDAALEINPGKVLQDIELTIDLPTRERQWL